MKMPFSRALAVCAAVATLLSSAPIAHAATFAPGDLIKGPGDAVYYYGQNGKRYVFPNLKTYQSWYPDFSTVKTVTAGDLAQIQIGGNVTYRPGVKLVKITTDPKTYAVASGGVLRWVQTEQVARDLYGTNWNTKVDDIPDPFFINYKVGQPIGSAVEYSPSAELAHAVSINVDKQLNVNGPAVVSLTSDKSSASTGGTVNLTANATFQGSGAFQMGVIKNGTIVIKTCTALPCTAQSQPLAAGSTNNFTAEVTDTNGFTGVSSPVTITVPYTY